MPNLHADPCALILVNFTSFTINAPEIIKFLDTVVSYIDNSTILGVVITG